MTGLGRSINKTLSYAGYFNFPLYEKEIYLWLITSKKIPLESIRSIYVHHVTKSQIEYRKKLKKLSDKKREEAVKISRILSIIPSVKMVAITGSVAIQNPQKDDDIDLMIVVSDHALWITRFLITIIISLTGRRRYPNDSHQKAANTYCLNLWLEEGALKIPREKQNLYTAHEVLQILPIYDRSNYYCRFISTNKWVSKFLANAYSEKSKECTDMIIVKRTKLLSYLTFPINYLFYIVQKIYMRPKLTTETISIHYAYFHKINFSKKINKYLAGQ